jgi:hypothetical protein
MLLLWQRSLLLRLLKDLMWYSTLHWATLLIELPILFVLTNGTAGSADYTTTTLIRNCSCGCNYGNGIGTNNCGYDWWSTKPLALPLELRLRVQLSTTMPYCGNDHSASATEGSDVVFNFTLSNPSDRYTYFCID